jgi:hypothetical protein
VGLAPDKNVDEMSGYEMVRAENELFTKIQPLSCLVNNWHTSAGGSSGVNVMAIIFGEK